MTGQHSRVGRTLPLFLLFLLGTGHTSRRPLDVSAAADDDAAAAAARTLRSLCSSASADIRYGPPGQGRAAGEPAHGEGDGRQDSARVWELAAMRMTGEDAFAAAVGASRTEVRQLAKFLHALAEDPVHSAHVHPPGAAEGETREVRVMEEQRAADHREDACEKEASGAEEPYREEEALLIEQVRRKFRVVTPENGTILFLDEEEHNQSGVEVWFEVDTGPLQLGFPDGGALNVVIDGVYGAPTLTNRFPVILAPATSHAPVVVKIQVLYSRL
jgi:hypothetical protein